MYIEYFCACFYVCIGLEILKGNFVKGVIYFKIDTY